MQDAHSALNFSPTTSNFQCATRQPAKKRKVERACDACRSRKTKCDGPKMPNNTCSSCIQSQKECTYVAPSKPRGPSKAYVTDLEDKLERLEATLRLLQPDIDFSAELGPPVIRDSWKAEPLQLLPQHIGDGLSPEPRISGPSSSSPRNERYPPGGPRHDPGLTSIASLYPAHLSSTVVSTHLSFEPQPFRRKKALKFTSSADASDNDNFVESRVGGTHRLTINQITSVDDPLNYRFHGKSAHIGLIQAARRLKEHVIQEGDAGEELSPQQPGMPRSPGFVYKRREEFWCTPHWEITQESPSNSMQDLGPTLAEFPPVDLAESLISLYFTHVNSTYPLLHKPTFDKQWKQLLHRRSIWFSCVCLCIFAVASRWSNDTRVIPRTLLPDGQEGDSNGKPNWVMAGRSYFNAAYGVHRIRRSLMHPASLFEIQTFSLMAMYIRGSSNYPIGWLLVSVGIRKAQDVGAHRRNVYSSEPNLEDELWKRAFWMLVAFDRMASSALGRECGTAVEEFDLPSVLEVNDEYIEDKTFKQPPDEPCTITAFNFWLKLTQISTFTQRTLYAISPEKVCPGPRVPWTIAIVTQLQNAVAGLMEEVPEYLRWVPNMPDPVYSNQAMFLHIMFCLVQTLIYQPLVPPPMGSKSPYFSYFSGDVPSEFPFPAASIVRETAQSCARVIRQQMRQGLSDIPVVVLTAHAYASTLMMEIWQLKGRERAMRQRHEDVKELSATIDMLLQDVYTYIGALEWAQTRWENATFYLEKLKECLPDEEEEEEESFDKEEADKPSPGSYAPAHPEPAAGVNMAPLPHYQIGTFSRIANGWNWDANDGSLPHNLYPPVHDEPPAPYLREVQEQYVHYPQYGPPRMAGSSAPTPTHLSRPSSSSTLHHTASMQNPIDASLMPGAHLAHTSEPRHRLPRQSSSSSSVHHAPSVQTPHRHLARTSSSSKLYRPSTRQSSVESSSMPGPARRNSVPHRVFQYEYDVGDGHYQPPATMGNHNVSDARSIPTYGKAEGTSPVYEVYNNNGIHHRQNISLHPSVSPTQPNFLSYRLMNSWQEQPNIPREQHPHGHHHMQRHSAPETSNVQPRDDEYYPLEINSHDVPSHYHADPPLY